MTLQAKLFGVPELQIAVQPIALGGKTLGLLYALLISPLSRTEAAALLWGDDGAQSLRQALVVLRKLPEAKQWLQDGEVLLVHAETDVARFQAALEAGDSARALEVYNGKLLEGVQIKAEGFMEWLSSERSKLERNLAYALRLEIARLEQTHAQTALGYGLRLLELDPFDESALQIVLRLEVQLGRREAALYRLNQFRKLLRDELNTQPLPATLEILGQNNLARRYAQAKRLASEIADTTFWAEVLEVGALDLAEVMPEPGELELPLTVRLLLEKRIANSLETRFDATAPDAWAAANRIAVHFLAALETRAALLWWQTAAQAAQKLGKIGEAQAALFRALWLTEDELPRRDCLIGLGNLAEARNDLALLESVAQELLRLGMVLQDDLTLFHAKHRFASCSIRQARGADAVIQATEALHIATRINDERLQALANGTLGTAYMASGQLEPARNALLLARSSPDPQIQFRVFANLGSVCGMLGQLEEARQHLEAALTLARAMQNLAVVAMILYNLGATEEKLGRLHNAENGFREAIAISNRIGNASVVLQATHALAQIHAARGHWGAAFNTATEALELAGNTPILPQVQMLLGELEARFGRLDVAQNYFELAKFGFETTGNQRLLSSAIANLALLEVRRGHSASLAKQALETLQKAGHQDQFDHMRLELALICTDSGLIEWALHGQNQKNTSVQVAIARLMSLRNVAFDAASLQNTLESALEQEVYLDAPLGLVLLGQTERAREVQISSAAGLPKLQREAFLALVSRQT